MSRTTARRGFTLVELLIVMVILGVVGAAIVRTLTTATRVSDAQSQRSAMQGNLRAGAGLIPTELREINIDASGSDLIAISKDSVRYLAMRRLGLACNVSATSVTVRNTNSFGIPAFNPGDNVLLFIEKQDTSVTDDAWAAYQVKTVASGLCLDGKAGTLLTMNGTPNIPTVDVKLDAPLRTYEAMTLKVYDSGGRKWLGVNANNAGLQPVLGPLAAADSTFTFRDANGSVTTTPSSVRVIEAMLHGETEGKVSSGYATRQFKQDSLRIRVRLRNAS
jgi:prepilin-type N-terminal cleavage/methylation domain-containing protein